MNDERETLCPAYAELLRLLLTSGWVTLLDYCLISGADPCNAQVRDNFKSAIAHIRRLTRPLGVPEITTVRDGLLVYRTAPLPEGKVYDVVRARELAEQAWSLLAQDTRLDNAEGGTTA